MRLAVRQGAGVITIIGVALSVIAAFIGNAAPVGALAVTPVSGNPSCSGSEFSAKDDPPTLSGYSDGVIHIAYASERVVSSVTADAGYTIDAVIVKGGPNANVYRGAPYVDLVAPENRGAQQPVISHVEVCYSSADQTTTSSSTSTSSTSTSTSTSSTSSTSTTSTVTTKPEPPNKVRIELSGVCSLAEGGSATYTLTVQLWGAPATTGTLHQDTGAEVPFVIDESGTFVVTLEGHEGSNGVAVEDPSGDIIGLDRVKIESCVAPTTTGAQFDGSCTVVDGDAVFRISVVITGATGATGHVNVNGTAIPYAIGEEGSFLVEADGQAGQNTLAVTDDVLGEIAAGLLTLEDCGETDVSWFSVAPQIECESVDGSSRYTTVVDITGEPGRSGVVTAADKDHPFVLDAEGMARVEVPDTAGSVTILVVDQDELFVFGPTDVVGEDCREPVPGDTGNPPRVYATAAVDAVGACTFDDGASYSIEVRLTGDPGATGVVEVGTGSVEFVIFDGGSAELAFPAKEGDSLVVVTDDVAGEIYRSTITIEDCTAVVQAEQASSSGPEPGDGPAATQPTDVAVLGLQIEQGDQLPFTGPADGPLAATGATLLAIGLVVILATRESEERDRDLLQGWIVD